MKKFVSTLLFSLPFVSFADSSCNIVGQQDSYVFAISWDPGFCKMKPDKPECGNIASYAANNFTLHGL